MTGIKFCYYLAAIGSPEFEKKINILKHNLEKIHQQLQEKFDIVINHYDKTDLSMQINKEIFPFLENIYIFNQPGILSEIWVNNPYHKLMKNYDYILFCLDDIKIIEMDLIDMINIKNKYNIQFLQPKIFNGTFRYLKCFKGDILAITNRLEIFLLLLTYEDFQKYMEINDSLNSNLWGVDLLTKHFGIKTGIYYKYSANHELPSLSDKKIANEQMIKYLAKHGFSVETLFKKYPFDIEYVTLIKSD